jgi:hypothetical protein
LSVTEYYKDGKKRRLSEVAIDGNGDEIFESDLYAEYFGYKASDGTLKYLLARPKDEKYLILIDINGNRISDDEYDLAIGGDKEKGVAICRLLESGEEVEIAFE